MSLAYKLWRIGSVLDEDDVFELMNENSKIPDDPQYLTIDFLIENDGVKEISINKKGIGKERLFLTQKIGGTSNAYYLYPNIILNKKDFPIDKLKNLTNTLKNSICFFGNESHKNLAQAILMKSDDVAGELKNVEKGDYVFCLTINGRTFWECMPEVWANWVKFPFVENDSLCEGRDVFTNTKCKIGYKPNVSVFSYDNYPKEFQYRLAKNYALSGRSARNIRFGWLFAMKNLFFEYNDLEYCIIPNMVVFDGDKYKKILLKYKEFSASKKQRVTELFRLSNNEKKIAKELRKREVKKDIEKFSNLFAEIEEIKECKKKLYIEDVSFIKKNNDDINNLGELSLGIVLDYYFFELDRKDKSFRTKGSIEDVLPSRIQVVFKALNNSGITDAVIYFFNKTNNFIELKDYFARNEMNFLFGKRYEERKGTLNKYFNTILKERIYLARLLLTDEQISMDNLLERFEYHREKDYAGKKRIRDDGSKDWIQYSNRYREAEERIITFLKNLNKIKE